jgi:GTPase SAR1 family protein
VDIHETSETNWRKLYFGLIKSRWRWRRAVSLENIYDVHFKAIILGDKKVGKSSVLMRLVKKDVKKKVIKHYVSKFQMSDVSTSLTDVVTNQTVRLQFVSQYIVTKYNNANIISMIV